MGFEACEVIRLSGVGPSVGSCVSDVRLRCSGWDDVAEGSFATDWGEAVTAGVTGTLSVAGSLVVLLQQPIGRYQSSELS